MKLRLITFIYWTLTVLLTAAILCCLHFSFSKALLMGILLLPAGLIIKFTLPKILEQSVLRRIIDLLLLAATVYIISALLFTIGQTMTESFPVSDSPLFPILITLTAILFSAGDWLLTRYLHKKMPLEPVSITFTSDRKPVTMLQSDILYVESNDDETWIHATDGQKHRNKTPISQWENLLGMDFMRIHRSFLVARAHIAGFKSDAITLDDGQELPISRKYRNIIK